MSHGTALSSSESSAVPSRRCPGCEQVTDNWSAKATYCRPCNSARATAWKRANPERARAISRAEARRNREVRRQRSLAYYYRIKAEDPERIRAQRRAWSKTPKGRLSNRLKRHVWRGAQRDSETREYAEILLRDPCSYCGAPGGEIDHIDPVSAGGDGGWSNLTAACRSCNASKNDDRLLPFLLRKAS